MSDIQIIIIKSLIIIFMIKIKGTESQGSKFIIFRRICCFVVTTRITD